MWNLLEILFGGCDRLLKVLVHCVVSMKVHFWCHIIRFSYSVKLHRRNKLNHCFIWYGTFLSECYVRLWLEAKSKGNIGSKSYFKLWLYCLWGFIIFKKIHRARFLEYLLLKLRQKCTISMEKGLELVGARINCSLNSFSSVNLY